MLNITSKYSYLFSGSWLLFEQILRVLISSIYIFLLAGYLGPSDFGIFVYTLTILSIFKVVINFGIEDILVKFFGEDLKSPWPYLSSSFYIKLLINFILILIFIFVYYLEKQDNFLIYSLIILLFFNLFSSFEVIGFYYESQLAGKKIAFCKLGQLFFATGFKIYLLINQYDLIFFIIAFGLEFLLIGLFYCISIRKSIMKILSISFDKKILYSVLIESSGYLFISILGVLFIRIDQLMVQYLLDYEQLGYFGLSIRFTDVLFLLPVIFAKTIFPLMIEKSKDEMAYNKFLKDIFIASVWISTIIIMIILILGKLIINNYFSDTSYINSYYVLVIYIWALIPYFYNQITYRWLMINNKIKSNLIRLICSLMVNFLMNLILIPKYGIYGSATATLFSFIFLSFIMDLTFANSRKLFFIKCQSLNPFNFIYFLKSTKNFLNEK